jgi:hypothetical protein
MDNETGIIWTDNLPNTTYAKRGRPKMFKHSNISNFGIFFLTSLFLNNSKVAIIHKNEKQPKSDTIVASIRGDGVRLLIFWVDDHQPAKKLPAGSIQKAIKRINQIIMNEWID